MKRNPCFFAKSRLDLQLIIVFIAPPPPSTGAVLNAQSTCVEHAKQTRAFLRTKLPKPIAC